MRYQQWRKECQDNKKKNCVKAHNKACIQQLLQHLLQTQGEEKGFLIGLLLDPSHFIFFLHPQNRNRLVYGQGIHAFTQYDIDGCLIKIDQNLTNRCHKNVNAVSRTAKYPIPFLKIGTYSEVTIFFFFLLKQLI